VRGSSLKAKFHKSDSKLVSNWINRIDPAFQGLSHIEAHIDQLRLAYAKSTASLIFRTFLPSVTLAYKLKLIDSNPYLVYRDSIVSSTKGVRTNKAFEPYEINIILDAFKRDRFCSPKSAYKDSYYYPFVLFLSLTGCRPEDAIALTQSDVIVKDDRKVIRFSKAYSSGKLDTTKNELIRYFPINEQLQHCLDLAPIYNSKGNNLMFPSQRGGYLNLSNFTTDYFNRIVHSLIELGEIENDLTTYSLRHTFITQLIRKGIDPETIGCLVENSATTIMNHYLSSDKGITLPELFN
jgi:integrase